MRLSLRLGAVAELVTPGYILADIGTDHAYIPIALAEKGALPRALAVDIHRGPLARAEENIRAHKLEDIIKTRFSDGLSMLSPGEAESILIAGMGGALTVRILKQDPLVVQKARELILQPQSDVPMVRSFLEQNGWMIAQEDMVFEDKKYYPMMRAVPGRLQEPMSKLQLMFGPKLLETHHLVLYQYLQHEQTVKMHILTELENGKNSTARERSLEIKEELRLTQEALRLFREG